MLALDERRRLEPVALDEPRAGELLAGMPEERRMASWHLVSPAGQVCSAGAAFVPLADLLGHPRASRLLAPLRPALGLGYRFVAGNRNVWGKLVSDEMKRRADALIDERRR